MSLRYVTLTEAKSHLRVDFCNDDDHINILIEGASAAVKNYLKDFSAYEGERDTDDDYVVDSNGEPEIDLPRVIKQEVKVAVLIMVGEWYKNREGTGEGYAYGRLPDPVVAILYPLRDPALA